MKFVAFFEYSREDVDKLTPKFQKWQEALRKNPEKHIRTIFPPHYLSTVTEKGHSNGIAIFESDNEKIIEYIMNYLPRNEAQNYSTTGRGKKLSNNISKQRNSSDGQPQDSTLTLLFGFGGQSLIQTN